MFNLIYGTDAEEAKTIAEFMNSHSTRDERRGYAMFSDRNEKFIDGAEAVKDFLRSTIGNQYVAFARWSLCKTNAKPDATAFAAVRAFRQFCVDTGSVMKTYTSRAGEEI